MVDINAYFKYNADFGPVINQMRLLSTQANLLNQTLQNFDKQASALKFSLGDSLASDIGKMGGWNTKVIELTDSVSTFGKSLEKQELSLKQYAKEAIGSFSSASNAHKLAVREVSREMSQLAILGEKNGKQMGMMITPANINLQDFNTNLAVSRKQFDIFNTLVQDGTTKLINFGKNTQWAGRQITVGLTVPLTAWGNQVSKIFREVNVELTRFQKVYGSGLMSSGDAETIKMTENVKQLGIEFARTMGIAVKDTASLAADLAATGQEGQKLLNSIRETTRLATLGDVDRADAMKATLSIQNAFKVSTDELSHSVDFLNAVENQTSLSLQDLTTAIPKAGPVIKALGGDVKDLSLLMVALKEGGISAAEGANAIKSGMASLINPTKRAKEVAMQYGIDVEKIVQSNRGQLMPTIIEFQKQLQLLDDFGKAQVIENIFGKYQFARVSALFDNLNASSSQTTQVMELMGKSQRELAANSYLEMDTLMNSGAKRFQRATESIKAQFIDIGGSITTAITPIIENVSKKIGQVVKFFEKLPAPVKSFIKVATGLAVIAGPIIMIAGVFSNFLGYIAKGAMGIVNLGRRMSGIPVEKFKMLDDTQLMAQKSTDALSMAFDLQKTSVEKLNQVLAVYKKHLSDAITLNPGFLNQQVASQTTTGKPPTAKFQTGGSAWVPGSGDGDKVPAMLEPGEYVVNKKAAAKHSGLLDEINFKQAPRFQTGGRINGYANKSFFGDAKFNPEDLQNALKAWISPLLTGLRPFNNPTKRGGIQPYGERYPGFFADIFNQSMVPQENMHLMRGMQFDRAGGNMSPVAGTIMDSILRAQEGNVTSPRLEYYNAPFSHTTTRFTSFSKIEDAEFYKRFMTMFEKAKNKRSAESRANKIASGQIFPYLLDLYTGRGNNISGIPVSDLFQGQTQYGNEGEVVLPGGLTFPITGYGSDLKTRMLMLHSVLPGATKTINGREVPLAQRGGRINNYESKSLKPRDALNYFASDPALDDIIKNKLFKIDGSNPVETSQINILRQSVRQYEKLIKQQYSDNDWYSYLPNGLRAAIYDMYSVHRSKQSNLQAKKMGMFDSGFNVHGPGTYLSPSLKESKEWEWYSGKNLYKIEKSMYQFNKTLKGKGYIEDSMLINIIPEWNKIASKNQKIFSKNQGDRNFFAPDSISNDFLYNLPPTHPFFKWAVEQGYEGLQVGNEFVNWKIGKQGINFSPIVKNFKTGGRINNYESKSLNLSDALKSWQSDPTLVRQNPEYVAQILSALSPISESMTLRRKTELGLPGEMPKAQQIAILKAIQTGDFSELLGKEFSFSGDFSSYTERGLDWLSSKEFVPSKSREMYSRKDSLESTKKWYARIEELYNQWKQSPEGSLDRMTSELFLTRDYHLGTYSRELKKSVVDEEKVKRALTELRPLNEGLGQKEIDELRPFGFDPRFVILQRMFQSGSPMLNVSQTSPDGTHQGNALNEAEWLAGKGKGTLQGVSQLWMPPEKYTGGKEAYDRSKMHMPYVLDFKQMGGRINNFESKSLMPQKYADKQAAIEEMLALAHLEATTGRFAGMPVTDIGQRQDRMGGFSSAIPGVNGVYEINGKKYIVKGHSTLDSALIESRGTQLTQGIFGLTTPEQELIKFAHPETGQQMFGVRSPFDSRFAKTSGQIAPDAFFTQALAAIIRGDADLQADNLFDNIVTDTGAAYVSDRASQPRTLSGKKYDVATQARINFLMQKGGARRWFAEATAGIAASMTPEQYEAGFLNAIAQAQANIGGAIGSLENLTPEEKAMYELLVGDLSAANKIDWKEIHAHHVGIKPEPVKPKSAPTAKALEKKAAEAAEREQALKAGFPKWMLQSGGRVNNFADKSLITMFYGTGHGIKRGSAPKDWKEAILNGLNSKIVQKRSDNAKKFKLANSDRIEIAHTKSNVYKNVLGYNAKQWDGTEIFEVGLINNMLNMLSGSGPVGKFANKWMGDTIHTQPDSISEGKRLFKALENAVKHLDDKDAPKGASRNWISSAYQFLSNPENISYYGEKIKINDFIRGNVSPLQTLSEKVPKNIREKIIRKQSGGRINNFADDSIKIENNNLWEKRASAPKQYEGVLKTLPDWATRESEAMAVYEALVAAGVENPERKTSKYIAAALAHILPKTTNENGVYTKDWEAENLMKDVTVLNTFLETLKSRKNVQSRGGITAPYVVDALVSSTGLPRDVVIKELKSLSDGIHPHTRSAGTVMLGLARLFPQNTKDGKALPIGAAALLEARLKGDFYETIQSRALPKSLPKVRVVTVKEGEKTPQSRSRASLPGAPTMPKVIYPSMEGGSGNRLMLAAGLIPAMAAAHNNAGASHSPVAFMGLLAFLASFVGIEKAKEYISSRKFEESLGYVQPRCGDSGGITKDGRLCLNTVDELGQRCYLHKNQPLTEEQKLKMSKMKTNKRGQIKPYPSMAGGGDRISGTGATVNVSPDGKILSNTIDDMLVTSASGQPMAVSSRELLAVTPEGTVAGVTSPGDEARKRIVHPFGTTLIRGKNFRANNFDSKSAEVTGNTEPVYMEPIQKGSMAQFAASLTSMVGVVGQLQFAFETFTSEVQNGAQKWVAATELGVSSLQIFADNGMEGIGKALKLKGVQMQKESRGKWDSQTQTYVGGTGSKLGAVGGKALTGIGSAMGKVAGALGNPLVQIGLQLGMAALNKSIEIYNKEMEKARAAGNAAFKEPTETAKLMGVQLKSVTADSEKLGKTLKNITGDKGRGAYDKAFEKTIKSDYGDLVDTLKNTQTEQEKVNQLTNVYGNLIQRGMDPKNAKEVTAEIARQGQAMGAFNNVSKDLSKITDPKKAMDAQLKTLNSQMDILNARRKEVTAVSGGDILKGSIGLGLGGVGSSKASALRADTINKAIFGGNQDKWWAHALTGTGLDRNPFVQVIGGWLADKKLKEQIAAQLGATMQSAFSMAASSPTASNQALAVITAQFKNADWGKVKGEVQKILDKAGFSDVSLLGQFINSDIVTVDNKTYDSFKELGSNGQAVLLAAINAGLGDKVQNMLKDGFTQKDLQDIAAQTAKVQALTKIDMEVDVQLEDSKKQLEGLKTAVQDVFEAAIAAKQAELDAEDKRHEKALANLDAEAEKIGKKKDLLQENTDYYLKELQREKDAEDYYAKQRDTALGGLKALSTGDVFGFIGAQQQAASQSDQFGRDQSMQTIQDTADEEQKKLDNALKGIDDRKKAEDARHQSEVDNINNEIALLRKKEAVSVGQINKALDLIDKAEAMNAGDKGYDKAVRDANSAAVKAGITARVETSGIKLPAGTDKDIVKSFNTARTSLKNSLDIMAADTTSAVTILNNSGRIASNVFKSLGVDPAKSKAYKEVFDTLQKPLDPDVKTAIQEFVYGKADYAGDKTTGKDLVNPINLEKPQTTPKSNVSTTPKLATGGAIYGAGTATSDSIPAMLSNGEYVVKASSVAKYGVPFMNAINAGRYAGGGGVGVMPKTSVPSSPTYSVPSTPSISPSGIAQISQYNNGGYAEGNTNAPTYHFNFNGAGMDMVMGHVNKAMGGIINNNSRGVYN